MNTSDYGRHASGYRKPDATEADRRLAFKAGLWLAVLAVCLVWVLTHSGCAHPVGNGLASLVGFGFVPIRLACLLTADALPGE
ncbi:hypothetical protein [Bifidobacterium scaligerum]|uniref:Uncharacterized protein n=1 Tax=Bifidobacterium scaligerum TaxID=2052656 RepID=A0A2M9HT47_9BIFI|nr:hypothetical protein [Bifidobacterium scaligerum]PJM79977.1 hypothetical protein CUU80_02250 [Bifidobacterium scaligerum]